jgi:hypothetical protein
MTTLQLIAGAMAGVDEIVMHSADEPGRDDVVSSIELLKDEIGSSTIANTESVIENIESMDFEWGVSDGN